jgi:predicted metal-dependent hydrolase
VSHAFRPRRVAFDHAATPSCFVPGDPHTSHVLNVLHLLLPAGERVFCEVFRKALPLVEDEALQRDVKAFIGQEAIHSRAHGVVLDHLEAIGVDHSWFTRRVEHAASLARVRTSRWRWLDRRYLVSQLAVIAAIEHFTSVMGWWIVVNHGLDDAGADPEMMALLRWHGAEEVEHRSVAFDTFEAVAGGPAPVRKAIAMLGVFVGMFGAWILGTGFLLRKDPSVPEGQRRPSLVRFVRAGRRGLLPTTRDLLGAVPRYLSPGFHPSHEGRTEVAVAYLIGARGVVGAAAAA